MAENNGFTQERARVHSDLVLPSQNLGWIGPNDTTANQRIGQIFRPRVSVRRLSRTLTSNTGLRLQVRENVVLPDFIFVTDVSDFVKLVPTIRFDDEDDSLDRHLVVGGTLVATDNDALQSEGDGQTKQIIWPPSTGANRLEPEWSCMMHGSAAVGNNFIFRAVRQNGQEFEVSYAEFCRVTATDGSTGVAKLKTDTQQSVCLETDTAQSVNMKSDSIQSVYLTTDIC